MSKQEASVAAHQEDPWPTSHPMREDDTIFPDISDTIIEWTIVSRAETNLRGIDPKLEELLDETEAHSFRDTPENPTAWVRHMPRGRPERAGQPTENSAIQTALTVYAVQIMEAHRADLRSGGTKSDSLFQHIAPVVEGLVVKNPKLTPEANTLRKIADCAKEYVSMTRGTEVMTKSETERCWQASNILWGCLLKTPSLPKELQLMLTQGGNHVYG